MNRATPTPEAISSLRDLGLMLRGQANVPDQPRAAGRVSAEAGRWTALFYATGLLTGGASTTGDDWKEGRWENSAMMLSSLGLPASFMTALFSP